MRFFGTKKHVFGVGAAICGVLILGVLTPKTVHAVAAALVQVTNTSANPVPALPLSQAASQQILLQTPYGETVVRNQSPVNMVLLNPVSGIGSEAGYVVPSGQNLVVTGVDLIVYSALTGPAYLRVNTTQGSFATEYFNLLTSGLHQLVFQNGLTYPAGSSVIFDNTYGNSNMEVIVRGYLTPQ